MDRKINKSGCFLTLLFDGESKKDVLPVLSAMRKIGAKIIKENNA
ncbi:hypothetical protein [uncultured Bartonella sp.]|nr:hypothetical protein [uncultured Bartonella sp.]